MPPKFGNYLFRNLKNQQPGEQSSVQPPAAAPLNLDDQLISLTEADFASDEAFVPALTWDQCPARKIEVKLGDTSGFMTGRVTILAGTLRRIAGPLVPAEIPDDLQLPIALKTVVLQIQPHLQQSNQGTMRPSGPDFDTPIAQVAREDEGFFKLEKTAEAEKAGLPVPPSGTESPSTPVAPAFPLIREKPAPPVPAAADPIPPSLPVTVGRPQPRPRHPDQPCEQRFDPFAVLPPVGSRPSADQPLPISPPSLPKNVPSGGVASETSQAVPFAANVPLSPVLPGKPTRRAALERLQEIFMTEDLLDFGQVLRLVGQFPRVTLAFAVGRDGMVYGEAPALGSHAALAVGLSDAARRFARLATGADCQGITLLSETPLSIVGNESLSLILLHEGRSLPPGMKERVSAIAQALSELLPPALEEPDGSS